MKDYTNGIIELIPFEDNNCIFSGGSLYDIISGNDINKNIIKDFDIFMYGDFDKQHKTVKKLVNNLAKKFKITTLIQKNIVNIFFDEFPKTVQIINYI